jgi:phospholipase C
MPGAIESVIVLMLENRSFDHMLGFLPHPSPNYPRLTGNEENPAAEPAEPPIKVSATARTTLALDPAHDHGDVMLQLTGKRSARPPYVLTNSGFVVSYEGVGLRQKRRRGFGPLIMKCQPPGNIPVLATLASSFAVCTRWFCSVPGQTWPNRNFAHAATSDGEVDNSLRFYTNPTVFETLGEAGRSWRIYHRGAAQSWAFRNLWLRRQELGGFDSHGDLMRAIADDRLPAYSFVEPDHFWPRPSSQHPANNEKNGEDFARGEALIRNIYSALLARPAVFEKTLLVITYDEHGGTYDREPPPSGDRFKDGRVAPGGFAFDLLGPRVPTVLVSPRIPAGTIDATVYDHSSIVATLRRLFAPGAEPLSPRDAIAETFERNLALEVPRGIDQMPRFQTPVSDASESRTPSLEEAPDETQLDDFQHSLVILTEKVAAELQAEGTQVAPSGAQMDSAAEAQEINPISAAPLRARQEQISEILRRRSA